MKLGFLSDAHSNYQAFLKSVRYLKEAGASELFFLGDSIGYFDGNQVPLYIYRHNITAIRGNHEEMAIQKNVPDDKEYIYRLKQHYDSSIIPIISSWEESLSIERAGKRIYAIHGSLDDPIWGYSHDMPDLRCPDSYDLVVCGATHRPFVKELNGKIFANIGSCGFPRDLGEQGSCGIYDTSLGAFKIIRFGIQEFFVDLEGKNINLASEIYNVWKRS